MLLGILIAEAESLTGGRAIQLALAPVFLLTGVAGLLNVMTGRLSRVIARGRQLIESPQDNLAMPPDMRASELRMLERRRHLASMAITTCTLAALLVCTVILLLFVEVLLELPLKWLEGMLFAGATLALIVSLMYFLREVHLSSQTVLLEFKSVLPRAADTAAPGAAPDQARDIGSGSS
jgi:Protein of unknown function (DUF2721)